MERAIGEADKYDTIDGKIYSAEWIRSFNNKDTAIFFSKTKIIGQVGYAQKENNQISNFSA